MNPGRFKLRLGWLPVAPGKWAAILIVCPSAGGRWVPTAGGGGGWGSLDDQLHHPAVALEADQHAAVLPGLGERAEDAAAGVHPQQLPASR